MRDISRDVHERAVNIKMLIMDCDGVLTDGGITLLPGGEETKSFDSKDGHGLRMAIRGGLRTAIISGRASFAVRERARDLDMSHLYEKAYDKIGPYETILAAEKLTDKEICYVGDDVTDIPLIRRVGLGVAVADSVEDIKTFAHLVTDLPGGRGAIREVIEVILRAQGKWEQLMQRYVG